MARVGGVKKEVGQMVNHIKKQLDSVSPTLCLAKWTQVTIHLQNGQTHSCHHPSTHKVPLKELKGNPSALHNTKFKKEKRKEMLKGIRPRECDYCWRIEDAAADMFSDRHHKSSCSWSYPHFNEISKMSGDENFDPTYVEVSFSNACNFKCMYCSPHISSKWMDEIKQYGYYPTSDKHHDLELTKWLDRMPIPNNQYNPYQEAFWEWWPSLYKNLHTFRITGGEPLMAKDTFKVLDYIEETETPNTNLILGVNSNLGTPDKLINKFIKSVRKIVDEKRVRKFELYTSAEAYGERNDYIRYGMNYDNWINNLRKIMDTLPEVQVTMMCAYNALGISSFTKFLKDMELIKEKCGKDSIRIDIPYVRHPDFMDCKIMKEGHYIKESWHYMKNSKWFNETETHKMERIYRYWKHHKDNDHSRQRRDLTIYLREIDKRRRTIFKSVFPEFKDYYNR